MAAGDITLTSPINKIVLGSFTVAALQIYLAAGSMTVEFKENGLSHYVVLDDSACSGFGISAGVFTENIPRAVTGEYTKLLGILFGAGANTPGQRRTAAVQALITDGIITVVGTVG